MFSKASGREVCSSPLVALVRDGNAAQKASAAAALEIHAQSAGNQVAIAKAGGIPPLVALVRDGNAAQKRSAARALKDLAGNGNNRIAIAIAKAVALVRDLNAAQKVFAALAFLIPAVVAVVALVRHGNAVQKRRAVGALEVTVNDDNRTATAQRQAPAGGIHPSAARWKRRRSAEALEILSQSADNHLSIAVRTGWWHRYMPSGAVSHYSHKL